jgi:formylglycine-generating enzyme required for sulfatase activity
MLLAMHLETFLYMLLQSEKTIPPPGPLPDFKALSEAAHPPTENAWIKVPTRKVRVGLVEEENQLRAKGYFGWDNEKPSRTFIVPAFEAKARPITNKEYSQYLVESEQAKIPASWISISSKSTHVSENNAPLDYVNRDGHLINGRTKGRRLTDAFLDGKAVRTLYGPVPLIYAFDWPVIASYDELAGCAKWMDGRIPTMEEVRSIYAFVEELQIKDAGAVSAENIPAVNGYVYARSSMQPQS